jgi:hypothetical protein
MKRNGFLNLLLAAALSSGAAFSGSPSIGVANAAGSFSLNNAVVQGSSDVFNGARLDTISSPSEIHLQSGADVRLSSKSSGTVFADHAVLERGAMRVGNFDKYSVEVRQLQIQADSPGSEAVVRLKGNTVEVASLGGSVRVGDGASMLTHVAAGTKMSFQDAAAGGRSGAQSGAQTGAPSGRPKVASDTHVLYWFIGVTAGAAIAIGAIAAAKGKSPF